MSILIVDDNPLDLTVLSSLIAGEHPDVVSELSSSLEGIVLAGRQDFDLIVVDYEMPQVNGLAFLRAVRRIPRHADTPVVMVTASHESQLRLEALEDGATDFITKPYDPAELRARIRNLVKLSRAMRALRRQSSALESEIEHAHQIVLSRETETVFHLSRAAEYRDPETAGHIRRTASLAKNMAEALGMSAEFCHNIYMAMPMHDIGKLAIPDEIMSKPGALSVDERAEMERHALYGAEILSGSSSELMQMAAQIALTHHERWNGSGYPHGIAGEDIPIAGRIAAVADVYDALRSARPYKAAWPHAEALEYLDAQAGRLFDPFCVRCLANLPQAAPAVEAAWGDEEPAAPYRRRA